MNGTYTEKLATGGDFHVLENGWYISYYFPGPDRRYNGTYFRIDGSQIDSYISAWINNYQKYTELKSVVPSGGSFTSQGEMGMTITVGGYSEGVWLKSRRLRVNSETSLNAIVEDYKNAKKRAEQISALLQML